MTLGGRTSAALPLRSSVSNIGAHMADLFSRLLLNDDAQDVVEYALLTAGIGLAGIAAWPLIAVGINNAYAAFDADTQDIWEVPDPGSN